jgi:hypothetical protein
MKYLILTTLIFTFQLSADILTLKSGEIIENIKTKVKKDSIVVTFQDSTQKSYQKSKVKSLLLKPVVFTKDNTINNSNDMKISPIENEKIRISEVIEETSEFEVDPSKKIILAILNPTAKEEISEDEIQTFRNLIQTSIVKTKLVVLLDSSIVNSSLKESGGENCPVIITTCETPPIKILENQNVSKVLQTNITKVENKYFITGSILDTKSGSVEFSETMEIESQTKFSSDSILFSKKIIGGVVEVSKLEIKESEEENRKYIWKSFLYPGLGQYSYGNENSNNFMKYKGISFMSLFTLQILRTYSSYVELIQKDKEYKDFYSIFWVFPRGNLLEQALFIQDGKLAEDVNRLEKEYKTNLSILGFIYILNLIDVYFLDGFFVGIGKQNPNPETGFQLQIKQEQNFFSSSNHYNLIYGWKF